MKDKTGKQEIEVGSYVVYATTLGRSAGLKFGKIIEIKEKEEGFAYRVVGVDDNWTHLSPEINKPGTLLYENRMVILSFDLLPAYAQEFLKDL